MNDDTRPAATEPIAPTEATLADPLAPTVTSGPLRAARPEAAFSGRTPRKTEAVRAGLIVGTGLVVALGVAVAMGASPSAAPSTTGGQTQTQPGNASAVGPGGPDFDLDLGGPKGGPGRGDGRGFGQISVTAVSGSSLSLATADGWTRTIAVTSTTTITRGGAVATLADIAVGDEIRFRQTRATDGTFTITAVEIVQPHVAGTVTAIGADSITLTLRDGSSQTIKTTGSTVYHLERADGARSDVKVGSRIVASGEKAADGTLNASSVWVRLPHVAGTVTATTADAITLGRRDGTTVTVHVGSGTTIRVAGVDGAKLSDIKTGMGVVVEGTQRADGSIDATAIGAGGPDGFGRGRGHDGQKGAGPDDFAAPSASPGSDG
ncbi:MAG: DUF5666 domain-containing protein [Candidatus Limnocylindrales bacterium]